MTNDELQNKSSILTKTIELGNWINIQTNNPNVIDPRQSAASALFNETSTSTQVLKLYKTTRAGATTSLCIESVKRKELCLFVSRTNNNFAKAVKEGASAVAGHPVKIMKIAGNSFCPRIMEQTEKYPSIKKIGFTPLPNCDQCDVLQCPIREAFDASIEEIDGYALTYAKLQSLIMSESKKVQGLLKTKLLKCRNIIFDEAQILQETGTVSVVLWEREGTAESTIALQAFKKLCAISPLLQKLLEKVTNIYNGIQPDIVQLKEKAKENHHLKHLALSLPNPEYAEAREKQKEAYAAEVKERERLQKLHPDKSLAEIIFTPDANQALFEDMIGVIKGDLSFDEMVKAQELLINAIKHPKDYDLTDDQIVMLSKLLIVTNANTLAIAYVRGADSEQISLQAQDTIFFDALRIFLSEVTASEENKRIIFTSATFGSINLEKLLLLKNIKDYNWGDPLNTSDKFLVVADKSRLSNFNFDRKSKNVTAFIDAIIARYGAENVAVCAMSKKWATRLGYDCTWYGSDVTEGVASSKRIWIFVGLAEKPINAKDAAAIVQAPYHDSPSDLQGAELYYLSQKLRTDSVNITTYQAISRAKDPNAKNRSVAIMIGSREDEVEKCLLWGPTRALNAVKTEKGLQFEVDCKDPIGKPHLTVAPLNSDVEESLHIIDQWISNGQIMQMGLNWPHVKKLVDSRGSLSAKRLINVYKFDAQKVSQFLNSLPAYFTKEGIKDYVLIPDVDGAIKGIATSQYSERLTESSIIYSGPSQNPAVLNDWFNKLKDAVDRAPSELSMLSASYFSDHTSASTYSRLSEFLDVLALSPGLCPGWIVTGNKKQVRDNRRLVRDVHCLGCWAPDYPRRFGSPVQSWADDSAELLGLVGNSLSAQSDAFVSVYAFPNRKHPINGGNPPVSTVFIDIDVESDEFSELKSRWDKGDGSVKAELQRLREALLVDVLAQAKSVVTYLKAHNMAPRILLSGFKGVHLFVDFSAAQFSSLEAAKQIMRKLTEDISARSFQETGVKVNFDPTVMGDLSRLCRIPNTPNSKACKLLGRIQYAVPVTVEAFLSLTPEDYDRLCSDQRFVPLCRKESSEILARLTVIEQNAGLDEDDVTVTILCSAKDPERLAAYEHDCTKEILSDEDFDKLSIRSCFKNVRRQRVSLRGGNGHKMRIGAVMELARQGLSIASIVRWFSFCGDYDPAVTEKAVIDLISRGYTDKHLDEYGEERRKGMRCETIRKCGFCLADKCTIYQKKLGGGD